MPESEGGCAFIVGGGTGIGFAAADRLLARGVSLGISGRRAEVLEAARLALLDRHPDAEVETHAADSSVEADAHEMVTSLADRLGTPSIFVDCAGSYEPIGFLDMTAQPWTDTIDSTLNACVYPVVAAARLMADRKAGRIVLIASTNTFVSEVNSAHYSAAKAGVSSLARSMCVDLAQYGIQANAIAPGWVHTEMVDDFVQSASAEALSRINPLGRVGRPDEVANLIEYLAIDAPDYLTGTTILIDGGQTALAPLI